MIQFGFEGTALTDASDRKTLRCDLQVELSRETCDWLTQPVTNWLAESVAQGRRGRVRPLYRRRRPGADHQAHRKLQAQSDERGGFVGMYL